MVHRVVNKASVVVSLPFCPLGCARHSEFLWGNHSPVEPLRWQWFSDVD